MINLAFVEVKLASNKDQASGDRKGYTGFSFTKSKDDKAGTVAADVTEDLLRGSFLLSTKYTLIFLYDFWNNYDRESESFLATYGGMLHNKTSANITILTYLPPEVPAKWENVYSRDVIRTGNDEISHTSCAVRSLKIAYNVKTFPSLIVLKRDAGVEEYCTFDFSGYKKEGLYEAFKQIIKVIDENCDADFSVIRQKISGPEADAGKKKSKDKFELPDLVETFKTNASKRGYKTCSYKMLAEKLDIDVRTLSNKRKKEHSSGFTRDECICIGLVYGIDVESLNELLRDNDHVDIGLDDRDGIIRRCLSKGCSPEATNLALAEKGWPKLLQK